MQPLLRSPLAWLFAPTAGGFFFALRAAFAGLLALGIAMWMELDNPGWALVFVMVIANPFQGEGLSKARWCISGTLLGTAFALFLTALVPQSPWLFYLTLACWTGLCAFCATLSNNFRAYGWALAGFTAAIVALDAAPDGNTVFPLAVARATYISIGTLTANIVGIIGSAGTILTARRRMDSSLTRVLAEASRITAGILQGAPQAFSEAQSEIPSLLALDQQIEFFKIELGPYARSGDHARAALSALTSILCRGLGLRVEMEIFGAPPAFLKAEMQPLIGFLNAFPVLIKEKLPFEVLREVSAFRARLFDLALEASPSVREGEEQQKEKAAAGPEASLLAESLAGLLGDLGTAFEEYYLSKRSGLRKAFRFRRPPWRDYVLASHNGFRAMLAVLIPALIVEVTTWSTGMHFIAITAVVCCLFAPQDHPVMGSVNYFKGMIAAAVISWFLVMYFMPLSQAYEMLCITLGGGLMLGSLARVNPATTGAGMAYGFMLPLMVGFDNQNFTHEVQYYNMVESILGAGIMGILLFRAVLPYSLARESYRLRRFMLKNLWELPKSGNNMTPKDWLMISTGGFTRLVNHAGPQGASKITAYVEGLLATMTLGVNLIELRDLVQRGEIPSGLVDKIRHLIAALTRGTAHTLAGIGRLAALAKETVHFAGSLYAADVRSRDIPDGERLELMRVLTYLMVIAFVLDREKRFLARSIPFSLMEAAQGGQGLFPHEWRTSVKLVHMGLRG